MNSSTIPAVQALDPNKIMPVNITLPAQPGTANTESRVLTIQVPASALQENQLTQILTANLISSIMSLPANLASSVLQQHVNSALQNAKMQSKQLDGAYDTSDEDNSDISDNDIDNDDDDDIDNEGDEEQEGEFLGIFYLVFVIKFEVFEFFYCTICILNFKTLEKW